MDPDDSGRPSFEPFFASEAERAVFASLTEEETAVLAKVQKRLQEAAGDVEAHLLGATFW